MSVMSRKIFPLVVATSLALAGAAAAQTPGAAGTGTTSPGMPGGATPRTPGASTPSTPGSTMPAMPGGTAPGSSSPGATDLAVRCPLGQARRPGSSICMPMSPGAPPMHPTR